MKNSKEFKIVIRNATVDDAEFIAWTVLTALDMDTNDMDKVVASCSDERSMYSWKNSRIAIIDGKPSGCLISYEGEKYKTMRDYTWSSIWEESDDEYLNRIEAEAHPGEFYLDSMAVLPEYRGLDIGKLLLLDGVKRGIALACDSITLLVDQSKPRLKAYYEAIGFERYGEMEFLGHDYFRMRYGKHN